MVLKRSLQDKNRLNHLVEYNDWFQSKQTLFGLIEAKEDHRTHHEEFVVDKTCQRRQVVEPRVQQIGIVRARRLCHLQNNGIIRRDSNILHALSDL